MTHSFRLQQNKRDDRVKPKMLYLDIYFDFTLNILHGFISCVHDEETDKLDKSPIAIKQLLVSGVPGVSWSGASMPRVHCNVS